MSRLRLPQPLLTVGAIAALGLLVFLFLSGHSKQPQEKTALRQGQASNTPPTIGWVVPPPVPEPVRSDEKLLCGVGRVSESEVGVVMAEAETAADHALNRLALTLV